MNYGLYVSASGVLTNMHRQDVFANNLANVHTVGFKPNLPTLSQRAPESVEDGLGFDVSNELLDRLGGGVLVGPSQVAFKAGTLQPTGRPLDVALTDDNAFFAVRESQANGTQAIRLTRDGRLHVNDDGALVLASGQPVLDVDDQPIVVDRAATVDITDDGRVLQNGEVVAQLQVSSVADPQRLIKQGDNLFGFEGGDPRQLVESPAIRPGFLENSGADPIQTLMQLISASKSAMGNANMIRYHDLIMDRAVNRLGAVA